MVSLLAVFRAPHMVRPNQPGVNEGAVDRSHDRWLPPTHRWLLAQRGQGILHKVERMPRPGRVRTSEAAVVAAAWPRLSCRTVLAERSGYPVGMAIRP